MLSSVLRSNRAILLNIQTMLVFSKIREMLLDSLSLKLDIEEIKRRLNNQDKSLELVFTYLDELNEEDYEDKETSLLETIELRDGNHISLRQYYTLFLYKLFSLDPMEVEDFLNYHFEKYGGDPIIFIKNRIVFHS